MKITASQARLVLSGGKTVHRVRALPLRSKPKNGPVLVRPLGAPDQAGLPLGVRYAPRPEIGRAFKLRPDLEGRAVATDALWITADWGTTSALTLRAEGFKTPVDLKLDWLCRYDAAWLEKAGDDVSDDEILARFAQRWAVSPAWLLTLEPITAGHHLLPTAQPRSTDLGYSPRIVPDALGPPSPSIDPLEAGEAVDRGTLERFARDAALRRTEHQRDADTERRLVPLEQQLADLRADAAARGVDIALHEASIQRRIDAARKRVERRAA